MEITKEDLLELGFVKDVVGFDGYVLYKKPCIEEDVYISVDLFLYVWLIYRREGLIIESDSVGVGQLNLEQLNNLIKALCKNEK